MDTSSSMGTRKAGQSCSRAPCTKDAHGSCQNTCCKFCCVVKGGCPLKGHNESGLSQVQLAKLGAIKASSRDTLPSLPLGPGALIHNAPLRFPLDPQLSQPIHSFEELARHLAESNPVLQMQREEERNARQQQEDAEREAEIERQEEESYSRAIAESLALVHPPPSPGPLSSSSSSGHRLVPPVSDLSTSLLVHGLPVTRVTASNRPTITSHMNDDWMRAHEDRTKLPQPIRKGQIDTELVQKFRVIWWSAVRIHFPHFTLFNFHCRLVPNLLQFLSSTVLGGQNGACLIPLLSLSGLGKATSTFMIH